MSIVFFGDSDTSRSKLPYAEDAIEESPELIGTSVPVIRIVKRPKGLLVVTDFYVGFLFANTSVCENVLEAIEEWSKGTVPLGLLVTVCNEYGKLSVGIDSNVPVNSWTKTGKEYTQVLKKKRTSRSPQKEKKVNPLLSPPSSLGQSSKDMEEDMQSEYDPTIGH